MATRSMKVAVWVGMAGILLTIYTGDGSAKAVSDVQPMKLAAMEGLYHGKCGEKITAFGILNPKKTFKNDEKEFLFDISIPYGLSWLARGDIHAFVPGVTDLINGVELTAKGDTIHTVSYAERIKRGKEAHNSLRSFDIAKSQGNKEAMDSAHAMLNKNYQYFGYGYFDDVAEAIPNVHMVFYSFHIMVLLGGYFLVFFIVLAFMLYKSTFMQRSKLMQWLAITSIPLVWICSEAGWVTAEVGRQPWIIEGLMPTQAAISDITTSSVQITFFLFAIVFTGLLIAEISIMLRQISKESKKDIENSNK